MWAIITDYLILYINYLKIDKNVNTFEVKTNMLKNNDYLKYILA